MSGWFLLWLAPLSLLLLGCGGSGEADSAPQDPKLPRFLALGDSYTIGESVPASERWPVQLAALLRQKGTPIAEPTIVARTGWTTDELADALAKAKLQPPYDLVSLLIGVNNQYRGRDPEEYRKQFAALLRQAIGFAGGKADHVLVLSIPDWGVTPYANRFDPAKIAREIDRFNAIKRDETKKGGAVYIDITPQSREASKDRTLIARDELHPSGKMYAVWAEAALPKALAALKP